MYSSQEEGVRGIFSWIDYHPDDGKKGDEGDIGTNTNTKADNDVDDFRRRNFVASVNLVHFSVGSISLVCPTMRIQIVVTTFWCFRLQFLISKFTSLSLITRIVVTLIAMQSVFFYSVMAFNLFFPCSQLSS